MGADLDRLVLEYSGFSAPPAVIPESIADGGSGDAGVDGGAPDHLLYSDSAQLRAASAVLFLSHPLNRGFFIIPLGHGGFFSFSSRPLRSSISGLSPVSDGEDVAGMILLSGIFVPRMKTGGGTGSV